MLSNKNYNVVRNTGWARFRNTWKSSLIFYYKINSWIKIWPAKFLSFYKSLESSVSRTAHPPLKITEVKKIILAGEDGKEWMCVKLSEWPRSAIFAAHDKWYLQHQCWMCVWTPSCAGMSAQVLTFDHIVADCRKKLKDIRWNFKTRTSM